MPEISITNDGSHSIKSEHFNEMYHSQNGAIQESLHVFIDAGFQQVAKQDIAIFEMGFGTGLNALLTLLEAEKTGKHVYYEAVELYPISLEAALLLNFTDILGVEKELLVKLHNTPWNSKTQITPYFTINKQLTNIQGYNTNNSFDVVYFDAFSPETQPELWSENVFTNIYNTLNNNGLLVTYSSKGIVKQALRKVGFTVQRLLGAAGKRHMLRAVKNAPL